MAFAEPSTIVAHWNKSFDGIAFPSNDFYGDIERRIAEKEIKDARCERGKNLLK